MKLFVFLVDAVLPDDPSADVTEQGKGHNVLVGKDFVGKRVVHAHTQDLGVGGFQLSYILLEASHLLGSIGRESPDIEG